MKALKKVLVVLFLLVLVTPLEAQSDGHFDFATTPRTNNGEKWRVGYYEGGEYIDYQKIFSETVKGLMKLGWIEEVKLPPQKGEQTKPLWDWLSTEAESK